MNGLGFITLIIYIFMLIGVEKYRMYVLPFAGIALVLIYLKEKKLQVGNLKLLITYFLILGVGYLFNLLSPSGAAGGEYFLVVNTIFLFAFIFMNFIRTSKELSIARWSLIVAGGILGILCIREYGDAYFRLNRNPELLVYYRAGAFEKYFYSGVLLMVTGTITIAKLYVEKIKWSTGKDKIITVATVLLAFLMFEGMLFTKTRSAIYTYILGFIIILFYKIQIKKALIFLVALFAIYMGNPNHVKSFSETITVNSEEQGFRQESDNLRRVMWNGAYAIWKKHPIVGVGNDIQIVKANIDSYSKEIEDENGDIGYGIKGEMFRSRFTESHSMYLNFLMQGGMIVILFLSLFFYIIPEQFIKNCKNIKELKLMHKIGSQKIDDVEYPSMEKIEMYESLNAGAIVSIINLLVVGIAWDIWGWAFQVQEIFQLMVMFLLVISVRISKFYECIRSHIRSQHEKDEKILQGKSGKKYETGGLS